MKREIKKLLTLCVEANKSKTHHIWFHYSGHVDWIDVQISRGKNLPTYFNKTLYLEGSNLLVQGDFEDTLKEITKELNDIIKETK